VGYAGGHTANPSYQEVCTGRTGHAEVVRVVFDPSLVSYRALLEAFWSLHDPTQVNRQGPDVGSQYRSLILVGSPEQEAAARESMAALQTSGGFPGGPLPRSSGARSCSGLRRALSAIEKGAELPHLLIDTGFRGTPGGAFRHRGVDRPVERQSFDE
jgi:hypothetical protein